MEKKKIVLVSVPVVAVVVVAGLYMFGVIGLPVQNTSTLPDDTGLLQDAAARYEKATQEILNSYVIHPETDEVFVLVDGRAQHVAEGRLSVYELQVEDLNSAYDGSMYSASRLAVKDADGAEKEYLALYRNTDSEVEHLASLLLEDSFEGFTTARQNKYGIIVTLSSENPFKSPYVKKDYSGKVRYEQYYSYSSGFLTLDNNYKN